MSQLLSTCRKYPQAYGWVLAGCERANTLIINPHKWLFTPVDCSIFYTHKPHVVKAAFSLVPEYLA